MADSFWESSSIKGFDFGDETGDCNLLGVPEGGPAKLSDQIKRGFPADTKDLNHDSLSSPYLQTSDIGKAVELSNLVSDEALFKILKSDVGNSSLSKSDLSPEQELKLLRNLYARRWCSPDINLLLTQILTGQACSLENFKSISSKKELLKAAVTNGNGNAILTVVLFLSKTLKKSLFYEVISSSQVAIDHYVNYLTTRMQVNEAVDLLKSVRRNVEASVSTFVDPENLFALGRFLMGTPSNVIDVELKMVVFKIPFNVSHFEGWYPYYELDFERALNTMEVRQFSAASQNPKQLAHVKTCASKFSSDSKDKILVENYVKLIEWQVENHLNDYIGKSLVKTFQLVAEQCWGDTKGMSTSMVSLCQQQGLSERQYQWTFLTARAKVEAWPDIDALFFTKGWLGGIKVKSVLPMDKIVLRLHSHHAPLNVLTTYLEMIDNTEKRIAVAKKLGLHKVAIDAYAGLRDRQGLMVYVASQNLQPNDSVYAETTLRSPNIKWKN